MNNFDPCSKFECGENEKCVISKINNLGKCICQNGFHLNKFDECESNNYYELDTGIKRIFRC